MGRIRSLSLLTLFLCSLAPATAGIWEDVYRGLQISSTPIGGPSGERFGRVQIVPNELGRGYRLEFDRSFGNDSLGRPEVYDLGNMELELRGRLSSTAQFTRRGILTGNADVLADNLTYALRGKTGLQDFELAGALDVDNQIEINQLGFYTMSIDITNSGSQLTVDGNLVTGTQDTDFDIGPINVRGNVFADIGIALLGSFGVDTSQLEQLFPGSGVDRIVDEIQSTLEAQAKLVTEKDLTLAEFGPTVLPPAVAGTQIEWSPALQDPFAVGDATIIPEPSGLMLVTLGALIIARRR